MATQIGRTPEIEEIRSQLAGVITVCVSCGGLITGDHNDYPAFWPNHLGLDANDGPYCWVCNGYWENDGSRHEPNYGGFDLLTGLCWELAFKGLTDWPEDAQYASEEEELILSRGREWLNEHLA